MNPTPYVACPPHDLPRLPSACRAEMQPEVCETCGCEVWIHGPGYLSTLLSLELSIICETCNHDAMKSYAGVVVPSIAFPPNWQRDLHNPELN